MAAKQRATKHQLTDGFVVAWDSSKPNVKLKKKLTKIADRQIDDIVARMTGDETRAETTAQPGNS